MEQTVITNGYPSLEEIKVANGWPDEARFAKGPVAIIECVQEIPCNPCEDACPAKCISVGSPITNVPRLNFENCTGCGLCVAACSGLAIFIINNAFSETEGTVSFPFEYLPLPQKGDEVDAMNRAGEFVCKGTVVRVLNTSKNDHTPVLTVAVAKEHTGHVRTIKRLNMPSSLPHFVPLSAQNTVDDSTIVCRCEEVSAGDIRKAIREYEGTSITALKRRVRCGMGLCQGKTCGRLVTRILQEELGIDADALLPSTDRPPVRPITFGELANNKKAGDENA